jgi:hypothetical protein
VKFLPKIEGKRREQKTFPETRDRVRTGAFMERLKGVGRAIFLGVANFVGAFILLTLLLRFLSGFIWPFFEPPAVNGLRFLLVLVLAIFWTLVRMEWLGFRFQPRRWAWHVVTGALWLLAVAAILLLSWNDYTLLKLVVDHEPRFQSHTYWNSFLVDELPVSGLVLLRAWLSVCALGAMLGILRIGNNLKRWAKARTLAFLILLSAAVIGFPLARFLYLITNLEPLASDWFFALRIVVAPLVLLLCGMVTISILGIVFGAIGWLFVFLLNLPLRVFDYLKKQEEEAKIRSQKKQGLADYFNRFDLWLRHDPRPEIPDDSKGSRFATANEAAAIGSPGAPPYGYLGDKQFQFQTDKHVLVMASTRGGKGVSGRGADARSLQRPVGVVYRQCRHSCPVQHRRFRDGGLLVEIHRRPYDRNPEPVTGHLRDNARPEPRRNYPAAAHSGRTHVAIRLRENAAPA